MKNLILAAFAAISLTAAIAPLASAATFHNGSSIAGDCKPPIETSLASPIEMSQRQAVVIAAFGVTCDDEGVPDGRPGTDPAARDDRSRG